MVLIQIPGTAWILYLLVLIILPVAWLLIRLGLRRYHQAAMTTAFVFYLVAQVLSLVYSLNVRFITPYSGSHRLSYFIFFLSDKLFGILTLPAVIILLVLAFRTRFYHHRRIARFILPLWFYADLCAVILYSMLKADYLYVF